MFVNRQKRVIETYFWEGFRYKTILKFLSEYHGLYMSYRTLKRRLPDYCLSRRKQPSSLIDVWNAIRLELQGPGN